MIFATIQSNKKRPHHYAAVLSFKTHYALAILVRIVILGKLKGSVMVLAQVCT